MIVVENIAQKMNIDSGELIIKGVKAYLENQLKSIDIYRLAGKYGVKNFEEFLERVQAGKITESIAYEDFFIIDNLTAQRDNLINYLKELQ
jgi:hypothetical protein